MIQRMHRAAQVITLLCAVVVAHPASAQQNPVEGWMTLLEPATAQRLLLAREDAREGRWDEAAQSYALAAQIDPLVIERALYSDAIHAAVMRLYDRQTHNSSYVAGWVPRTLTDLNRALDDAQARRERALLYAAVGNWEGAVRDL